MKISGARAIIKALEGESVDVIFGYPGAAICPFYDELAKSNIRHILSTNEQNAGHSANGYSRLSKKVGVCVATSGPGATNLITALATAYMDSIPIIAITGQIQSFLLGRDLFQEADITGAAEPFTKHSYLIKDADDILKIFKEAFYIASSGRPGPVLIDIPIDVQEQLTRDFVYNNREVLNIRGYKPTINGNPIQIKKIIKAIEKAERPILCVGGGVFLSNAEENARLFSEKFDLPVVCTMMGFSLFNNNDPRFLGLIGVYGKENANNALSKTDCLIILGARVCDRSIENSDIFSKDCSFIHIDVDPAEIGKNVKVTIPLVGDCNSVLDQLLHCLKTKISNTKWINYLKIEKEKFESKVNFSDDFENPPLFVNPEYFFDCLSKKIGDYKTTIVTDVGQNQIWAIDNLILSKSRFITSGGMGTMGYSLPAAIGAKIALNQRDANDSVIVVCGDGAFLMCLSELSTIKENNLNIKIIILHNGVLGMVKEIQKTKYKKNYSATILNFFPDLESISRAYSIPFEKINNNNEIEKKLNIFLKTPYSHIIEININPNENTIN